MTVGRAIIKTCVKTCVKTCWRIVLVTLIMIVGTAWAQETLNASLNQDPYIIDPTANWLYDVTANMFVTLVGYDFDTGEVVPAGATSWDISEDGTTYTFTIRDDWTWSDGQPVTAHDYEYAFQRIADPATAAPMAYRIYIIEGAQAINQGETADMSTLGVTAVDETTLEIQLSAPSSWFLSSLGSIGHAVPQQAIDAHGEDWTLPENIVVNGPYILTDLEPENLAVLEKNPSYFNTDNVDIDVINLFVVQEESTALALFEDDMLDIVSVPSTDLDRIKNDPTFAAQFYNVASNILYYYNFNAQEPPFDDVRVRQAFAAATDKQGIVEFITKGGEIAASTLTPPGSFGHVANEQVGIPYDPERASELLAEAGYPNGEGLPTITLAFNASETHSRIAQAIQQMWGNNLGVTVELQSVEGRAYSEIAAEGAFNVWRMGWGMDYPDANNIHAELFTTEVGARALVRNSEYDRIVAAAAVEQDPAVRQQLYVDAERILVEELAGVMPIYWSAQNLLVSPDLNPVLSSSFNREFWKWSMED